jgi:glycosyltransferase involved in cell wall biosynthesis
VAYGTQAKEYLISLGAKEEAIFFMWNTVDVEFFDEQSSALSCGELQEIKKQHRFKAEKIILYVGQLIKRKGLHYLIDAFARLKQEDNTIGLAIVGYGPQEEELRQYCLDHNIQDVYFSGYTDPFDLPQIYATADLFVLPSTEEVWGLVLNEAMACGLPVISTNVTGASIDLIQNGVNGYIVEAGNTAQLYEAMQKIMSDPERRQIMGEKSREIILSRFTIDHAVQGLVQAVDYVCARKKGMAC